MTNERPATSPDGRLLSPDVLDKVLTRASELDATRRAGLTVLQARQVAAEAGIPESIFDQALQEVETGSLPTATDRAGGSADTVSVEPRFRIHPALVPVGGVTLGWLARLLRPYAAHEGVHYEAIFLFLILLGLSAQLLFQHTRRGDQAGFQRDAFSLWGGCVGGWALLNGGMWSDMTFVFSAYWGGIAIVGGTAIEWLRHRMHRAIPAAVHR